MRFVLKMPIILLTDREIVTLNDRYEINDKQTVYLLVSCGHDDYPLRDDLVRLNVIVFDVVEQRGSDLVQTQYTNTDMKGSLPTMVIN